MVHANVAEQHTQVASPGELSDLEEEDLELIQENLGRSGFRRLQYRTSLEADKDADGGLSALSRASASEEEEDDDEMAGFRRKRMAPEELERLFDEDEEESTPVLKEKHLFYDAHRERALLSGSSGEEDELGDFIADEDEEERAVGSAMRIDEESGRMPRARGQRRQKDATRVYLEETFGARLPGRVLHDILDIFGDGTDYLGLADDGDDDDDDGGDGDGDEDKGKGKGDAKGTNVMGDKDMDANGKSTMDVNSDDNVERSRDDSGLARKMKGVSLLSNRAKFLQEDIPERLQTREGRMQDGEIEEEASWIAERLMSDPLTGSKFSSYDSSLVISTIASVLGLFRDQKLEVPTVATHRKEHFQHMMGLNDLWTVWDLDEQWMLLRRQKSMVLDEINSSLAVDALTTDEQALLGQMVTVSGELEMSDIVSEYLRWHQRERKHDDALSVLIKELADGCSLAMLALVENIKLHQPINAPPNPLDQPEQLAASHYAQVGLKSASQLLNLVVAHMAALIGHHPCSHFQLRSSLCQFAAVNVQPTERGQLEVDLQHELAPIKFIREKPIDAFQEDQFLLVVKGQSVGLLTYAIVFPRLETAVDTICSLYDAKKDEGVSWSGVRFMAVSKAIQEHILPKLKRDLAAKLRSGAERWLAASSQYLLQDKLMTLPYNPQRLDHPVDGRGPVKVMAVSWGRGGPDALSMVAIVDERGRVLEQRRIPLLHEKHSSINADSWTKFNDLILTYQPSCVVLAGHSLETRDLLEDVRRQVARIKRTRNFVPPAVIFGEDDTARLYMNSPRGRREWPDAPPLMRYCISLARRLLNPLFEFCALDDAELLALENNPMLSLVAKDTRLLYLHRAFINVVNLVGVDVNLAVSLSWARSPLKYVCGLGPSISEHLIQSIGHQTATGRIDSRNELLTAGLMGPRVFANCASFLLVSPPDKKAATSTSFSLLDTTRIHPENYVLARKMAADAMELALMGDEAHGDVGSEEEARKAVAMVMKQPERLNDLLLDEYAKELVKRGQPSKHLTLLDIKAELQNPYADLRSLSRGPSDETLFEMLTGETERTLWVGAVVRCLVVRVSPADRSSTCRLDSGLTGRLSTDRLRVGQSVQARIVSIHTDRLEVELREVRSGEPPEPRFGMDPYFDLEAAQSTAAMHASPLKPALAPTTMLVKRLISHPAYHNVAREEAERMLEAAVAGEVVIRPSSSRGPTHLTLTWKVEDAADAVPLFQHLSVACNPTGKGYLIGEMHYEDLDEIIARHIEAVAGFLRDIKGTPKYLSITSSDARLQVESHLLEERRRDPTRIAYCFSLSHEHPGQVLLSFQPSSRSYHEIVHVTPTGFILRGEHFAGVEALVAWFKTNPRNAPVERPVDRERDLSRGHERERERERDRTRDRERDWDRDRDRGRERDWDRDRDRRDRHDDRRHRR